MRLEVARGAEENEYVGSVFQYLKGAIRGYIICYWLAALSRFQYLKGAIRGLEQIRAVYPHERFQYLKGAIRGFGRPRKLPGRRHFNTSRVRLEAYVGTMPDKECPTFQYLKGAIRGIGISRQQRNISNISIPQGCD